MLKFGYITELDVTKGMVRVNFTDLGIVSNLLPVSVPASKEDKYSFPFAINEHVWCLMDDNCEFGVVGGAIYSNKDVPDGSASEQSIDINIGAGKVVLKISRLTGEVSMQALKVFITSPDVEITGALNVTGALTAASFAGATGAPLSAPSGINVTGDVSADGVSLKTHRHTGAGAGNPTSTPIL